MPNFITDILKKGAEKHPDKIALAFEDKGRLSYARLQEQVEALAAGLAGLGVEKGDKVALFMPNCLEIVVSWFAANKLGAVEVPINLANKGSFLSYIINNSGSKVLVVDQALAERVRLVQEDITGLEHVVVWSAEGQAEKPGLKWPVHAFEELLAAKDGAPEADVALSDPVAMVYTSGTTGPSKGVLAPAGEALMAANEYAQALRCTPEDVFFTCLPLFHANAQLLCVLPALSLGSRAVIAERFSASSFWRQIEEAGATVFNSLGAMANFLYSQPPCPEEENNKVRAVMAAPMPANIYEDFAKRYGVKIIEGYGLTETGMITYNPWDSPKIGSCGQATPNYEVKIFDDGDNELPPDTLGEIVVRSRTPYTMCLGYHGMPEKTVETFRNFFFHTGDAGVIDSDGYLFFQDRVKDYIRRRGENISSFEVERAFLGHGDVAECAAVAVSSQYSEDEVMVVITPHPGKSIEPVALMDWAVERMPYFAVPRYLRFVDALPKTPNEKIKKNVLRDQGVTGQTWDREAAGYKVSR